jgi:hypothetical protein
MVRFLVRVRASNCTRRFLNTEDVEMMNILVQDSNQDVCTYLIKFNR